MSYFFIGLLAGSLVTSQHDTKEACEGRKVTLSERGVTGQCVAEPTNAWFIGRAGSTVQLTPNGVTAK